MRLLIGLTILVTLALLASSQRFYRWRRTRLGAALTTGGWLMVAIGFAVGPFGARFVLPEQLLEVEPLILFCLGWIGLMIGMQAHRSLPRLVPGSVFRLAGIDLALSVIVLSATSLGILAAFEVSMMAALPVALLLGVFGAGWSAEVRSLQRRIHDADHVMPVIRAGAGISSLAAVAVYGLLFKSFSLDAIDGVTWSAPNMALGVTISIGVGLTMGLMGQWLMGLAGRSEGEFLVVLLGLVTLTAGAAATLGYSPLLVAALGGAVIVNLTGKALRRFQRVIIEAEQPVGMALMLVAGVLADPRLSPAAVSLMLALVIVRGIVKLIDQRLIRRAMKLDHDPPALVGLIRQNPLAIAMAVGYAIAPLGRWDQTPLGGGQVVMIVILMGVLSEAFAFLRHGSHEQPEGATP